MRATETDVPDSIRPYLNEIAERLWAERAAVMVGAGFSKNAGHIWSWLPQSSFAEWLLAADAACYQGADQGAAAAGAPGGYARRAA